MRFQIFLKVDILRHSRVQSVTQAMPAKNVVKDPKMGPTNGLFRADILYLFWTTAPYTHQS